MENVRFNRVVRLLMIAFVAVLLVSVIAVFAACKCSHDYQSEITKPASCTAVGEMTYTCSACRDSYTVELPMLTDHELLNYFSDENSHWQACSYCDFTTDKIPHEYITVKSSEPSTCTKQGYVVKACVCGKLHTELLQFAEHNFSIYQMQGDKHCLKCADCNATGAEVEHEFVIQDEITISTCIEQGRSVTSCICGAKHIDLLPLAEHKYTEIDHNSISHWNACSVCYAKDPEQDKISHSFSVITIEAECEKSGKTVTTCSGCDYILEEFIPALEHELDETSFSKSSTRSGHYYKCERCKKDIVCPHLLTDCECPNGYNRVATCYKVGHQDQQCSICDWSDHFTTPMTNEHNFSSEWSFNGTFHWHACLNGNGECSARSNETQHIWAEVRIEPTCTENGNVHFECECGAKQSGSDKTLIKLGHDYETIEVIKEATCEQEGLNKQCCTRCNDEIETATKKLEHVMQRYVSTIEGHYRKCLNCEYTQSTLRNHTWIDSVEKEATCLESGLTVRTCEFCKFTYEQVTTKNHNYITDPESYVDATCESYGTHVGTCSYCGDTKLFVDEYLGYADHIVKEYPAKEMTDTEPGNRHYWQCTVCKKYFTSHACVEELTEDQVFIYPPMTEYPANIAALIEIGKDLPNETESDDYYQLTATVEDVYIEEKTLMIGDGKSLFVTLVGRENISTVKVKDVITLKGKLFRSGDDVMLLDCEIVSVTSSSDGLYSLSITMTEGYSITMYAYSEMMGDVFLPNTNNYNCLLEGDSVIFCLSMYKNVAIKKVIINGKAYTMTNGEISVPVTEDICAEFVLGKTNECSVRIREIDTTNNNGNAIAIDEYISYTYTNGGYNDYGRLYKDSHLTFTSNNANIIGINITYDAEWLTNNPQVLNNTVNAIKQNGNKVAVSQGSADGSSQITITLSSSDAYTALEYFANASQARVVEIIVLYETFNS